MKKYDGGPVSPGPSSKESVIHYLLFAWFVVGLAYVILVPVSNNFVLYPILLLFGVFGAYSLFRYRSYPSRLLSTPALIWIIFVLFGLVVGLVRSAEDLARPLVFLAFWPAVFAFMVLGFRRSLVRSVLSSGAAMTVAISILFLLGALFKLEYIPINPVPDWLNALVGLRYSVDSAGSMAFTSRALPSLLWWGAIWMSSLLVSRADIFLPPVWLRFLAASLSISAVLVSGRRGIVLALILVPLISLILWVVLNVPSARLRRARKRVIAPILRLTAGVAVGVFIALPLQPQLSGSLRSIGDSILTVVVAPGGLAFETIPENVDSIEEDNEISDTIRANESQNLLDVKSPADLLVGHGFGSHVERGLLEREIRPWQSELQYHLLFHWTGLVGIALLLGFFVTSLYTVRKAARAEDPLGGALFITSVGAIATLAANATNPYLQAPGHMWIVFLPLMIAAVILPRIPAGEHYPDVFRRIRVRARRSESIRQNDGTGESGGRA